MRKKILVIMFIVLVSTLSMGIPTVAAESTLALDVPPTATAYNNARRLVRDSNGYLYAAYYSTFNSGVHIARSTDDGASWESTWAYLDSDGIYPSLAIDSQDNLHCVWVSSNSKLCYKKYTYATETWDASPTTLCGGLETGYGNELPAIAVDGSGNIHVVWERFESPGVNHYIYYTKYTTGWSTPERIDGGAPDYFSPSIAIDENNYIYVAYRSPDHSIYLNKYTTSWVETLISSMGSEPCIAIDSNNNPHIVYIVGARVRYQYYSGGSWSSSVTLDDEQHTCHAPSISIYGDNIHVLWYNNVIEHKIWHHFSTDNGATWPAANREMLATGGNPSLRWSFYNNPNVFGSLIIHAEWIYTAPRTSIPYDAKYDRRYTTLVGGEIIPVNKLIPLAPKITLIFAALALGLAALSKRRLIIFH